MDLEFNKNEDTYKLLLSKLAYRFEQVSFGGGQKKIDKLHAKGKMSARERVEFLIDKDSDFFKILYDNVLYRDIVARYGLAYSDGLKSMYHYLTSNTAKEFSFTTLKTISGISSACAATPFTAICFFNFS